MNVLEAFRGLHERDTAFVLPNAWDAASACWLEAAGAPAIGTTSAGLAASLGWPDNEQLPVEELLAAVRRMARVIQVPLSVDIEAGYFDASPQLQQFISSLLDAGIAGVNIQDACGVEVELMDADDICRRIESIAETTARRGCSVFINARTDAFWIASGMPPALCEEIATQRLIMFREAGAHGGFLPGLRDLDTVARIATAARLPINLLAHSALADSRTLAMHGVNRISLGSGLFRHLYGQIGAIAESALSANDFRWLDDTKASYGALQSLYCQ